jgi:hypothetical protein
LGKWFSERCSSLAGGLARQKAKDLEQVSDSGDGTTSGLIGKTLKVRWRGQLRDLCTWKTSAATS